MNKIYGLVAIVSLLACMGNYANGQQKSIPGAAPDLNAASGDVSASPPLPTGRSTILGGSIRNVDPVLDRFTLNIVGDKPLRIVFDERTQLFLDGKKISLRDLRPAEHASVQTTLDGTAVFAISIHILSQLSEGDYTGEVASYNPGTGDLELVSGAGGQAIRVRISSDTTIARKGQGSFTAGPASVADLQKGSLVSIQFAPDGKGRGTATEITLLATPGSQFVFSGNVIALDAHSGTMVLLDPRNNQRYQIAFSPATLSSLQNIHSGQRIRVTAQYNGTQYMAQDVTPY
jgi:hypothetical protein